MDVGCEEARGTDEWLARLGHGVVGYDGLAVMVEYAMAAPGSAWQPGAGSLEFRHGTQRDALEEFGAGSFDLILSHGVIMYHSDADAFLEEHLALARKGGMLSLVARNAAALAPPGGRGSQDALRLLDAQRDQGHLGVPARAHAHPGDRGVGGGGRGERSRLGRGPDLTDTPTEIAVKATEQEGDGAEVGGHVGRNPHREVAALLHVISSGLCSDRGLLSHASLPGFGSTLPTVAWVRSPRLFKERGFVGPGSPRRRGNGLAVPARRMPSISFAWLILCSTWGSLRVASARQISEGGADLRTLGACVSRRS